jgi:hypothetical protein
MSNVLIIGETRADARNSEVSNPLAEIVRRVVRIALITAGAAIMIAGFAIAPLPGPFGLPLAAVGLMIVLKNSTWAKRKFIKVQHRHPNWVYPVRRLMRREPEFLPVMWQQTLRMERLVLKRDARVLRRARLRAFRLARRLRSRATR